MKANLRERKKENKERKKKKILEDLGNTLEGFTRFAKALGIVIRGGHVPPQIDPRDLAEMAMEVSGTRAQIYLYEKLLSACHKEITLIFDEACELSINNNNKKTSKHLSQILRDKLNQLEVVVDSVADLETRYPFIILDNSNDPGFYYKKGLDKFFSFLLWHIGFKKPNLQCRKEVSRRKQLYPKISQIICADIIKLFKEILKTN